MTTEIELRALLSATGADRLLKSIEQTSSFRTEFRWFVDVSQPVGSISDREIDVRLRVTNGKVELAIKRGKFGGATRQEAILPIANGEIYNALLGLNLMGFSTGTFGARRIQRYCDGSIEISIHQVLLAADPSKIASHFVEFEVTAPFGTEVEQIGRLTEQMQGFGLVPMTAREWTGYAEQINKEWDGIYVFGETDLSSFEQIGAQN